MSAFFEGAPEAVRGAAPRADQQHLSRKRAGQCLGNRGLQANEAPQGLLKRRFRYRRRRRLGSIAQDSPAQLNERVERWRVEELAPGHSQVRMRLDQPRRQLLPGEDVERLIQFDIVPVVDARGCVAPQLLDQRQSQRIALFRPLECQ